MRELKEQVKLNRDIVTKASDELGIPEEKIPLLVEKMLKNDKSREMLFKALGDFVGRRSFLGSMAGFGAAALGMGVAGAKTVISDNNVIIDDQWYLKAPAPFSALVGIDGTDVIAYDWKGKEIARGKAGEDDAQVIQRAVDDLTNNSRGVVFITADIYNITSTITIKDVGISIVGAFGQRATILTASVNPAFQVIGETTRVGSPYIANLYLRYGGLLLRRTNNILVENVEIELVDGTGLRLEGAWDSKFKNVIVRSCGSAATSEPAVVLTTYNTEKTDVTKFDSQSTVSSYEYIGILADNSPNLIPPRIVNTNDGTIGLKITGGTHSVNIIHGFGADGTVTKGTGIYIDEGYRINIIGNTISNMNPAIHIDYVTTPPLGVNIIGNTFMNCGKALQNNGGQKVIFANNYLQECGQGDDAIVASGNFTEIVNNTAYTIKRRFINVTGGHYFIIANNIVNKFSAESSGTYEAIYLYNVHHSVVIGNRMNSSVAVLRDITEAGPSEQNIIAYNYTPNGISVIATDTIVKHNIGYTTENSGTATITAGNTSVTVAHGLVSTPSNVQVTPKTNPGTYWWYTADATNIYIYIGSAQASDVTFDWKAEV